MKAMSNPLVSCLCVTSNRVPYLQQSIDCFLHQSYPNKELVVVCKEDDHQTHDFINSLENDQIKLEIIPKGEKLTLGELRNVSIQNCSGDFFCTWDDDDWYHPDRIALQLQQAIDNKFPATMLTNIIIFDVPRDQAYFSHFRLWPQTLLANIKVFDKVKYPAQNKSEDLEYLNLLHINSKVFPHVNPGLYIYRYHGSNTWDYSHFEYIFGYCQKLSETLSQKIKSILTNKCTIKEAIDILEEADFLEELNYFYQGSKEMVRSKNVADK